MWCCLYVLSVCWYFEIHRTNKSYPLIKIKLVAGCCCCCWCCHSGLFFVYVFAFCIYFTRLERNFNLPSGYFVQRILWRDLLTVLTTNAQSSYDKIFNGLEYNAMCIRFHRMVGVFACEHEVGGFYFHNVYALAHLSTITFRVGEMYMRFNSIA